MAINYVASLRARLPRMMAMSVAILSLATVSGASQGDNIENFGTQSFAQIKSDYEGKPFVLSLWSIDCAPCRVELKMLGELKSEDADFPLVVISTDSIENREEAADILDSYGLQDIKTWMFADSFVERLRYSVDPLWHGELPRSYFFKADRSFQAHSGVLTRDQLSKFFPSIGQ